MLRKVLKSHGNTLPFVVKTSQHSSLSVAFQLFRLKSMIATSSPPHEFVDVGVNLTDDMFKGVYHGKKSHAQDLPSVLNRSAKAGVVAQMVTAGSIQDVKEVLALVHAQPNLYATAGVHPTRTSQADPGFLEELQSILDENASSRNEKGRIIAVGECGLDYDRLHFSDAETQKKHFAQQLELSTRYSLPLFLHCRAAQQDLLEILGGNFDSIAKSCSNQATKSDSYGRKRVGVVHCFTGSVGEMRQIVDQGLFVGLTGCSFKTEEGIELAREIPLERLLLETGEEDSFPIKKANITIDAPWCDMRPTHASANVIEKFFSFHQDLQPLYNPETVKKEKWNAQKAIKGRNEPCTIGLVAAVVAQAKGLPLSQVAKAARDNTRFLFGI